jgi:hypothetical protein
MQSLSEESPKRSLGTFALLSQELVVWKEEDLARMNIET